MASEGDPRPLPPLFLGNPYLNPHLRSYQDELLDAARKDGGGGGGGGGGASKAELKALKEANDAEHKRMEDAVAALKDANDAEHATMKENAEQEAAAAEELFETMQNDVDAIQNQLAELQDQVDAADTLRNDSVSRTELDAKVKQEYAAMEDRVATFEAQVTQLETTIQTLIAEIQEARQQDEDDATAKVEALAEKIAEKAQEDLSETRRQLKLLRSSVETLEENSAKLARQRIERLEERLEEIAPSRDAKVAPGRSVRI